MLNACKTAASGPCLAAGLPFEERDFILRFARPVAVPEFPVVTLRGLLGYALKDYLAPGRETPSEDSLFWMLFKPGDRRPHPLLIDCDPGAGSAIALRARFRAFGPHAATFLDACAEALARRGGRGFGEDRTPYRLETGPPQRPPAPWNGPWRLPPPGPMALELVTPAQLLWRGAPVDEQSPLLHIIVWAAVRRLRELAAAYGDGAEVDPARVDAPVEAARITRVALERVRAERTSSLDGDSIAIGGIRGRIELEGPPELARLLAVAAIVGIGKKVFAGNGRVRFRYGAPEENP